MLILGIYFIFDLNFKKLIYYFIFLYIFRLSYCELKNLCHYLSWKMKSSNFLEMMERQSSLKLFDHSTDLEDLEEK